MKEMTKLVLHLIIIHMIVDLMEKILRRSFIMWIGECFVRVKDIVRKSVHPCVISFVNVSSSERIVDKKQKVYESAAKDSYESFLLF